MTSPSSGSVDARGKLFGYMRTESVQHILILDPVIRTVVHHARTGATTLASTTLEEGSLVLDPPGIEVNVEAFFASV